MGACLKKGEHPSKREMHVRREEKGERKTRNFVREREDES